ncbi:MAG: glucose-6-phosphate isomerase [Thermotogota bacterium]|nr:glucose-6-phosphate isomerase [Thermotogota bacterium]MDK2864385.1 glucose-6-phosphate isomerase [Thermotogota bacterium]
MLSLNPVTSFDSFSESEIVEHARRALDVLEKVLDENPGFLRILGDRRLLESVRAQEEWLKRFDTLVVVGIGGSGLGNIAIKESLRPSGWNHFSKDERGGWLRVYVLDNVDPDAVASVLDEIDLKSTVFNVISKSGGTTETLANYLIVRGLLEIYGLDPRDHLIFTTDPDKGLLRKLALEEDIRTLEIPPEVGGRFSVLTPVGMLTALALGLTPELFHEGGLKMLEICRKADWKENPALQIALSHYLHYLKGRNVSVMMAYSSRLLSLADWYRQLWAESLGKRFTKDGRKVEVGQTPVKALGAVDQHSQLQLYNEGPDDKIITFLRLKRFSREVVIPRVHEDLDAFGYLRGHMLSNLLNTELLGTLISLVENGRPVLLVDFDTLDEHHLGMFFVLYELATAVMGELLNVNAYDQPGVERGKRVTKALMGERELAGEKEKIIAELKKYGLWEERE